MIRRKLAAFTIVQDEPEFLPKWLEHYGGEYSGDGGKLAHRDLFVLHHADGPEPWIRDLCAGGGQYPDVNVVPVRNGHTFDINWLASTVSAFQLFLLHSYDWVLFSEVDELVTTGPGGRGLHEYVDEFAAGDRVAVRCRGYEVVHRPDEPALDRGIPWLAQRSWWYPVQSYSKTLLSSAPLRWNRGFHGVAQDFQGRVHDAGDLYLVHLKPIDLEMALGRSRRSACRRWEPAELAAGTAYRERITTEAAMRRSMEVTDDDPSAFAPFEMMPGWAKGLV